MKEISLEEFFEADHQLRTELNRHHHEADRLIGTVTALEDLADKLSRHEKITLEDIDLVDTAETFASAGESTKKGDLMPIVTLGEDTTIAVENIFEKITTALATLTSKATALSWLAEKRLLGFKVAAKTRKNLLEELKGQLRGAKGMASDFVIKIKVPSVAGIKDKESFIRFFEAEAAGLEQTVLTYDKNISAVNGMVMKTLKSIALLGWEYNETMAGNFNTFKNDVLKPLATTGIFADPAATDNSRDVVYSKVMLSGKCFFIGGALGKDMAIGAKRRDVRDMINRLDFNDIGASEVVDTEQMSFSLEMTQLEQKEVERLIHALDKTTDALTRYGHMNRHWLADQRQIFSILTKTYNNLGVLKNSFSINSAFKDMAGKGGMFIQAALNEGQITSEAAAKMMKFVNTSATLGTVAAAANMAVGSLVTEVLDWGRKKIIGTCFSSMALQYKITKIVDNFDTHVISAVIDHQNRGERVIRRCLPK